METNREFTRRLAALILMLFAVAPARSQSGPDAFKPSLNGSVETLVAQPDGSPDTNFIPGVAMYGRRIIVQPDGRILVGGISPGPPGRGDLTKFLVRFETNGNVDASFNPPLRDMPFALALQADGKVVAGFQTPPYIAAFTPTALPTPTTSPGRIMSCTTWWCSRTERSWPPAILKR